MADFSGPVLALRFVAFEVEGIKKVLK